VTSAPPLRSRLCHLAALLRGRSAHASAPAATDDLSDLLELLEERVYAGEVLPDGTYVGHRADGAQQCFLGGPVPDGADVAALWRSCVHSDDLPAYEAYGRRLASGSGAEVTYRLTGLDGVTRLLWERGRLRRTPEGRVLVRGIISDVTARHESATRLAEASGRFHRLLDVVGEHVYIAMAYPDGRFQEVFQGPGADRLLGGAYPDPEMKNWDAAVHPDDREQYDAYNAALAAGSAGEVEYRLVGADGVTRWVHDRAATRRLEDGSLEVSGIVSDVTERRRLQAELAEAHAAVSRVVEAMDGHLYTLRVDGGVSRVVYRGPNREMLVGGPLPADGDGDRQYQELIHPEDQVRRHVTLSGLREGLPVELEYRVRGLDGRERIVLDRLCARRDASGALHVDGVARDITERRQLENELLRSMADMQSAHAELEVARGAAELRASTDELTGTSNRRRFAELVSEVLRGGHDGWALVLLDADHFKHVNDVYGHVVGDAVLVELAARLRTHLEPGDELARWGGEEFAVLLRGVRGEAALRERAERLRAGVARTPMTAAGVGLRLTVSVGAALAGSELETLDALVETADRCLYDAKRRGRNRVSLVAYYPGHAEVGEPEPVTIARAVALAAGAREGTPEAHAEQVAELSMLTAKRLGLPDPVIQRCRLGGWLHDVGKAGLPHAILDKPGPLDEREWVLMRTHPALGEAMIRGVAALREATAAVRHHHERIDGRGYPDGLSGSAIPIEARVVAAADAYAAMTATRPYSAARGPAEAAVELRRSAGTHLDAAVVAALLDVLGLAGEGVAAA
jgi:diguanylate cyclase (GGDEF)-like protein/PAS domain S-box-containing protein